MDDMRDDSSPSTVGGADDVAPLSAISPRSDNSPSERPNNGDGHASPGVKNNNGGNATNAAGAPTPHGLNPRSCVTCRKRKVKCDKSNPCSNCRRAGIDCIFPKPGRAPRRSKKAPDSELLARLRRLEGVVQKMGKTVDGEDVSSPESSMVTPGLVHSESSIDGGASVNGRNGSIISTSTAVPSSTQFSPVSESAPMPVINKMTHEMGRLVVEQGKSRYVSNKFWAQLTGELAELQELLDEHSSGDEAGDDQNGSPGNSSRASDKPNHQDFIFGYSALMTSLRILHPHPRQIMTYWSLYKENIDPVLRLLHKPSIETMFFQAANDLDHLPKSTEVLMFAIYLTVVTSLSPEECRTQLDLDKEVALKRYRFATEQALAKAGLVETQELRVLQAAMLFLAAVRRFDGTSFVWSMTGLVMRIGQRQGLHRDGSHFGLCPFDTEERRRLWWQLATFDGRVSDDQGVEPMCFFITFDTNIPLNIHDEDIWPGMTQAPAERERPTDMVFDLTRYEIGNTIRQLKVGMKNGASVEHRDQLIDKLRERLETKYLRYCDMTVPLEWVTVNICRLVLAKIWLMAHYPLNFKNGHANASEELRHRTFVKSVDIIRYTRLLETQHKTLKWGWMFRTYSQWHAAAFAFDELRRRTSGPEVDEAWRVIEEAYKEWELPSSGYTKSILWRPITRLRAMAKEARRKEQERQRIFPSDGSIGPQANSLNAPLDLTAPTSWKGNCPMGKPPPAPINVIDRGSATFKPGMTMTAETEMPGIHNMGAPGMNMLATNNNGGNMYSSPFSAQGMDITGFEDTGDLSGNWMSGGAQIDSALSMPSWVNDQDMNWDELSAMVAAEPIDVNMGAMWGDPAAN